MTTDLDWAINASDDANRMAAGYREIAGRVAEDAKAREREGKPFGEASPADDEARAKKAAALKERIRSRVEAAQSALREELANQRGPGLVTPIEQTSPVFLSPLSLTERYRLFREAFEATVRDRAPLATTLVDKVGDDSCMVAIRCKGVVAEGMVRSALDNPAVIGRATAFELCRLVQARLGREATGLGR